MTIRTGGVQQLQRNNEVGRQDYFATGMESDAEVSMHESHLIDTSYNYQSDRIVHQQQMTDINKEFK
jgi:hypothetical protein